MLARYLAALGGWTAAAVVAFSALQLPAADLPPPPSVSPSDDVAAAIDHYLNARLAEEGVSAAPQASDATLVRRLTLDLAGRIPAAVEVREFIADNTSARRAALVDRLMASPEFVEQQAVEFNAFITGGDGDIKPYLRTALADNRSWDRVFREIILPNPADENGKAAQEFLRRRVRDIDVLANDVSVVFFGVNISCAKCHDHPLVSDWRQEHFYGMKSFFSRTFEAGGFVGERDYGTVKFTTTEGEEHQARLMFLDGATIEEPASEEPNKDERKRKDEEIKKRADKKEPPPAPQFSRRAKLVETALAEGQRTIFARAIVNRLWYQYFGHGLVMPLDQMHSANPSRHPELLDWLARDFVEHGFDLRRLARGIVMSQAYSRASRWEAEQRPDADLFAVAMPKPLTPTQMARSMGLAAADAQSLEKIENGEERAKRIASLASANNANLFVQPDPNFQVSAGEALLLTNGPQIEKNYLSGPLVKQLAKIDDRRACIEAATWAVLSRPADEEEVAILEQYLAARDDRREDAVKQLVWALLASSEFRFNH